MYTDSLLRVSSAQTVGASAPSTSSIDTATTYSAAFTQARDLGEGSTLEFHIVIAAACTAAGAATVTFEAIGATDAALTAGIVVLGATGPIGKAELDVLDTANSGTMGSQPIIVKINPRLWADASALRYIGLRYTVATGPLLTGAFTADLVMNSQNYRRGYVSGFAV